MSTYSAQNDPGNAEKEEAMQPVIYNDDTRYPGPSLYPPPSYITGIPSQVEFDAFPRMFTWGELKGIVRESRARYPILSSSSLSTVFHLLEDPSFVSFDCGV